MSKTPCAFDFPIIPEEVPLFSSGSKPIGWADEVDRLADALCADGVCGEGAYLSAWLQAEREGLEA